MWIPIHFVHHVKADCVYHFLSMQVENELVDLIDELLERDAGTVNSTIIGRQLDSFQG